MVSLVYANIRDIRRVDAKFIPTSAGGGGAPSGPASGDLGGTYPAPTITQISNDSTSVIVMVNGLLYLKDINTQLFHEIYLDSAETGLPQLKWLEAGVTYESLFP